MSMMARRPLAMFVAAVLAASPSLAWVPPPDCPSFIVFFAAGRTDVRPQYVKILEKVANQANSLKCAGPIRVAGHNDSGEGNLALSTARAMAVVEGLMQLGVSSSRLSLESWADQRLLVPKNGPDIPDEQNRRVEILFLSSDQGT
jgi:flagellar motor protein MotB